jgi:hypothetical protein
MIGSDMTEKKRKSNFLQKEKDLLGCSKNERRFSSLIHLFIGSDYL